MKTEFKIGTRKSKLAQIQTDRVIAQLAAAFPEYRFTKVLMETKGDLDRKTDLVQMGGQGVFAKVIQEALLAGALDMAVHSAKDLPSVEPRGLMIGAFPERLTVTDSLILRKPYQSLADLPVQAVVGTSSRRRRFQLASQRPDLQLRPLRGNIDTRLEKLVSGEYDAIVMAQAGINRYGLPIQEKGLHEFSLPLPAFLPAIGQGAIAVECLEDSAAATLLQAIDDVKVREALTCERAFLAVFGLGCNVPLAGYAEWSTGTNPELHFTGLLGNERTGEAIEVASSTKASGFSATELGESVAHAILEQADFLPE